MLAAGREPLPFLGDLMFLDIVEDMAHASTAVYVRTRVDPDRPFADRLAITDAGRAVLRGEMDWLAQRPPERWIGGVCIRPDGANWRWDETRRQAIKA